MRYLLFVVLFLAGPAWAKGERSGDFDYYVLSLSWSPNWCLREGNARNSPQCDKDADFGWVLHGLWPQFETGWPSYCPTTERNPSRRMTKDMADIMGTSGLAWHQWNKHGVCSGLSASQYYTLSREAFVKVTRPVVFRRLPKPVKISAQVIEDAFLKDNPNLHPDGLTVTCKQGGIQEVRICLSKDLTPRLCGRDVIRDCTLTDAELAPIP